MRSRRLPCCETGVLIAVGVKGRGSSCPFTPGVLAPGGEVVQIAGVVAPGGGTQVLLVVQVGQVRRERRLALRRQGWPSGASQVGKCACGGTKTQLYRLQE